MSGLSRLMLSNTMRRDLTSSANSDSLPGGRGVVGVEAGEHDAARFDDFGKSRLAAGREPIDRYLAIAGLSQRPHGLFGAIAIAGPVDRDQASGSRQNVAGRLVSFNHRSEER